MCALRQVAIDAVRQKVETNDWQREAAADLLELQTQLNAALRSEEFRQAAELKKQLDTINGANWFDAQSAISASRCVEAPSRRRRDSCPSHNEVGGFFVDIEAVRTALTEMLRAGGQWRARPGFDDINSTVWKDRTC